MRRITITTPLPVQERASTGIPGLDDVLGGGFPTQHVLLFRFFEARGHLLKAVSMVKSRTNRHEQTIREFRMGAQGLELGNELTDFEGVLMGVTAYRGNQPLLGDAGKGSR